MSTLAEYIEAYVPPIAIALTRDEAEFVVQILQDRSERLLELRDRIEHALDAADRGEGGQR